jgi:hypothetical protein
MELEILPSSTRESTASLNTISTTSDSNHYHKYSIEEEETEETKISVSTLDAVVVDIKSSTKEAAPSPGRLAMEPRRLKRERVSYTKEDQQQSSSSVVSRFVGSIEAKHRARRKDKREKLLEKKKKERLKKSS